MSYAFVGKTDSAAMIDAELLRDISLSFDESLVIFCVVTFFCNGRHDDVAVDVDQRLNLFVQTYNEPET